MEKSDWEIQIIEHFVNNNTDPKVAEVLRLIDLEHLGRYYPGLTDIKQKHQILIELLRSACFEKNRVSNYSKCMNLFEILNLIFNFDVKKQVMKMADKMLREFTNFSEEYLTSLMDFYSSKRFNAATILSWTETLDFLKTKPDITTEEILEIKELDPSILNAKVEVEAPSKPTKHKNKKGKHKSKKDKHKGKKEKKGSKDKTDKNAALGKNKHKGSPF